MCGNRVACDFTYTGNFPKPDKFPAEGGWAREVRRVTRDSESLSNIKAQRQSEVTHEYDNTMVVRCPARQGGITLESGQIGARLHEQVRARRAEKPGQETASEKDGHMVCRGTRTAWASLSGRSLAMPSSPLDISGKRVLTVFDHALEAAYAPAHCYRRRLEVSPADGHARRHF